MDAEEVRPLRAHDVPELWPEPLGAWVGEGGHCDGGVYGWGGPVGPCSLEWRHEGECEA